MDEVIEMCQRTAAAQLIAQFGGICNAGVRRQLLVTLRCYAVRVNLVNQYQGRYEVLRDLDIIVSDIKERILDNRALQSLLQSNNIEYISRRGK